VKDAVVHSYSVKDETRIAAYVIIDTALNLSEEISTTLKSFLSKFLPDYMVPSTITVLQEFPLTSNGKVDRKSLPIPDVSLEKTEYVAPITEIEKDLCEMWQELLGIEKVGINDNFFKLGGNSLAAARMVSKFKDHFNVDLPLHKLFGLSSLFELAVLIERQQPSITEDTFNRMDDLLDELGV
jgi:acyl carrier protein